MILFGTVKIGPVLTHASKTIGVECVIKFPDESYAATLYSPAGWELDEELPPDPLRFIH